MIGVALVLTFLLGYGPDIIGNVGLTKIDANKSTDIQEILGFPGKYTYTQIEIYSLIVQRDSKIYAKDDNGYKIEIRDCTKNRDLRINENQTIKGFILSEADPVFFCGIYKPEEYEEKIKFMDKAEQDIKDEQARLVAQQVDAQRRAAEQQRENIERENERWAVENSYELKKANLNKCMDKETAEKILEIDLNYCEHKTLSGTDLCEYKKIVNNKFNVLVRIVYEGASIQRVDHLSVEII